MINQSSWAGTPKIKVVLHPTPTLNWVINIIITKNWTQASKTFHWFTIIEWLWHKESQIILDELFLTWFYWRKIDKVMNFNDKKHPNGKYSHLSLNFSLPLLQQFCHNHGTMSTWTFAAHCPFTKQSHHRIIIRQHLNIENKHNKDIADFFKIQKKDYDTSHSINWHLL